MAGEFKFENWITNNKLSGDTKAALEAEELTEKDDIIEITDSVVKDSVNLIKLSSAQKIRLKKAVEILRGVTAENTQRDSSGSDMGNAKVLDSKQMQGDPELQQRLAQFELENKLMSDILGAKQHMGPQPPQDTAPKPGKALYINDFVSKADVSTVDEETELFAGDGQKLVLKSSTAKKPKAHEVTLSQWISGNARIMAKLIEEGELDREQILQYLHYTEKFGDMAQKYTISSLMLFDERFRKDQAEKGTSWAEDNYHATLFHLEKRPVSNASKQGKKGGTQRNAEPGARKKVCLDFNNRSGCNWGSNCKFPHTCAKAGCEGDHPQYQHPSSEGVSKDRPT